MEKEIKMHQEIIGNLIKQSQKQYKTYFAWLYSEYEKIITKTD